MASVRQAEAGMLRAPGFRWWHGIIIGLMLSYVPGSLLVAGVLLLPLVALKLFDPNADGQRLMIVLFYVGAVMVRPLHEAWAANGDWETCIAQITQPVTLALDWLAAGAAWLVAEASAIGGRLWNAEVARRERKSIEKRIAYLQKEWMSSDDDTPAT
ncbi:MULTISPECIES: hypothetical protein [Gluconobacter]|uniref:Transmembrane protein n=1 Tax=Gluconobacter albidus TaxID=318683 RepID=A0A149T463_9PROT|nr:MULTISPECIES: hypothetical protein [Gluconobacter]AQS91336.1 hypothetical protein A0U94_10470 [Gluconobacter albidus]KXV41538.1 hypothetical protein AD941_03080 [Gluconobacter albidus]KXV49452.1 hypothetical protein AD945_04435 [Gluconobacter albidus]MBS1029407.1 hypothetical protein [Gluconobacter albidus]MCP1274771.1 hypothetical protein [Gluconobacter albidus]